MTNNEKNQVMFKAGLHANLPKSGAIEGAFYLTTDSDRLYVGKADGSLADLNKYVKIIDTFTGETPLPVGQEGDFLYIKDSNILAVYTNGAWKQVNPDTDTNTIYDLDVVGATDKATIKLRSKDLDDTEFADSDSFNIIAGKNVGVVVNDDGDIEISSDACTLSVSNYDEDSKVELNLVAEGATGGPVIASTVKFEGSGATTVTHADDGQTIVIGTNLMSVESDIDNLQKEVDALEEYVGTFTSSSEDVKTVVDYIDAKTANIASDEKVNGIDNRVKTLEETTIPALEQDIADVDAKFADYDTTTVSEGKIAAAVEGLENGQVKLNKEAIELLNANSETTGSVDQKIKTAIADFTSAYITGNEDEVINRLQEIVDWINTDEDGVTKILADIAKNKEDIADLDSTKADAATTLAGYGITDAYTKTEVDGLVEGLEQAIEDLPDVTVAEGTGIDVAKSGDEYTVSLEAITKNDTTGTAKTQETKGTLSFDAVTGVTYDAYGRVTGVETTNITVVDTDTTIEDTHNNLDSVTVATAQVTAGASASVTHTVAMTDGESESDVFNVTSSYEAANGGVKVDAGEKSVNIDFVWGSF